MNTPSRLMLQVATTIPVIVMSLMVYSSAPTFVDYTVIGIGIGWFFLSSFVIWTH